jgi:hypothetical protein
MEMIHQYVPIVLYGTNRISTGRSSMGFIHIPWVLARMVIYCCFFSMISTLIVARAWQTRTNSTIKPGLGIGIALVGAIDRLICIHQCVYMP